MAAGAVTAGPGRARVPGKVWLPALRTGSGSDVYVMRLAQGLERAGVASHIDWFDRRYEFAPWLLRGVAPPAGCTLVLCNAWYGYAFRRAGLPLVVTEHHCVFDPAFRPFQGPLQSLYHRGPVRFHVLRSLAVADAVVAVSQCTADGLRRAGVTRPVEVLHNWVDVQRFHPAGAPAASPGTPSASPGAPSVAPGAPFRLLFVGNLSHRKGADRLPEIMRRLGPGFVLRFTSGLRGGALPDLPPNMMPIGQPDDDALATEYRQAGALLCPSRFEGFGYTAAEAMASGIPVIAGESPALAEVIGGDSAGAVCANGSVDEFVQAARQLAGDPDRARRLGAAGRERAERLFSEAVCVPRYLDLIARLAG